MTLMFDAENTPSKVFATKISVALKRIEEAARTYQPTSPYYMESIECEVRQLVHEVAHDIQSRYLDEELKATQESARNTLSAALAGLEISRENKEPHP